MYKIDKRGGGWGGPTSFTRTDPSNAFTFSKLVYLFGFWKAIFSFKMGFGRVQF